MHNIPLIEMRRMCMVRLMKGQQINITKGDVAPSFRFVLPAVKTSNGFLHTCPCAHYSHCAFQKLDDEKCFVSTLKALTVVCFLDLLMNGWKSDKKPYGYMVKPHTTWGIPHVVLGLWFDYLFTMSLLPLSNKGTKCLKIFTLKTLNWV